MSPGEAVSNAAHWSGAWWECIAAKARRFRKTVTVLATLGTAAGVLMGGWGMSVGAWRAIGAPVLATEAFVAAQIDEQMAPMAKVVAALDTRSQDNLIESLETRRELINGELFKIKQIDLSAIKDAIAKAAIESQMIDLQGKQTRIQIKLEGLMKARH